MKRGRFQVRQAIYLTPLDMATSGSIYPPLALLSIMSRSEGFAISSIRLLLISSWTSQDVNIGPKLLSLVRGKGLGLSM